VPGGYALRGVIEVCGAIFAAMVGNHDLFEASVAASERTQEWLDAIWVKALQNERR
jgi:hypothetical protein